MSPIRVLDATLINQIAAGEVIVRPASVVKELVENSLDAGAARVTIEVDKECRGIRVVDDGGGIPADEMELALCRHATSKIASLDDLSNIRTRGFRGEALASIAAVSRLEMTSRRTEALAGARLRAEGGAIVGVQSVGCPPGTTVDVSDLFYNTPARRKFMKTVASEWAQIQTVLTRQALAAPRCGFAVFHAGRKAWEAPAGQSLRERVAQLFGAKTAENLLEVAQKSDGVTYGGYISKPNEDRADRRQQFFFVNGRPIVSPRLSNVLLDAYKGLIMSQRHPVAMITIDLSSDEVDVNVHPTKEEVRFRNERMAAGLLHRALTGTLRAANYVPRFSAGGQAAAGFPAAPSAAPSYMFGAGKIKSDRSDGSDLSGKAPQSGRAWVLTRDGGAAKDVEKTKDTGEGAGAPNDSGSPNDGEVPSADLSGDDDSALRSHLASLGRPRPLGQIGDSYIIAEAGGDMLLIDQHAAHERALYHKFQNALRKPDVQPLLTPIPFAAAPADAETLETLIPRFRALGIEMEHFGGRDYVIHAVPADLGDVDITAVVQDLLDAYAGGKVADPDETVRERVITRMACHAAIKAGQHLAPEEIARLIEQILDARLSYTCPHGRPTMILLTKDQLDRQFKRK